MLRIRLRRTGAKKQPRYRVVVADVRAPRDGAFVDSIGYYDPLTEPSTISINRESALAWIAKGAQPSEPVEKLLRRAGIIDTPAPIYPSKAKETAPVAAAAPTAAAPAPAPVAAAAEPETPVETETAEAPEADADGTSADK